MRGTAHSGSSQGAGWPHAVASGSTGQRAGSRRHGRLRKTVQARLEETHGKGLVAAPVLIPIKNWHLNNKKFLLILSVSFLTFINYK